MAIVTILGAAAESPMSKARDHVEVLRSILTAQQRRDVSYHEAQDIGDSLIRFFEVLGTKNQGDGIWVP
jgi:hypothetical protein